MPISPGSNECTVVLALDFVAKFFVTRSQSDFDQMGGMGRDGRAKR